ncbi:hypothetical protein BDE02_14G050700 [Populus trichocarpa]|nr:hypothetical protein BDE02_14G050700 [Populus trichocarpa]
MTVLVTAALVRLLSLLSPLCPPVLSSFDFSVSEMNELRKYWIVIFYERDYRRETWSTIGSNPLQIFSQLNRDGEDEHGCSTSNGGVSAARDSTSNGNVSAAMDIFFLTPELWKFGNWTRNQLKISFNFAPFGLISIKSLNWYTVYKKVLNSWIVQFGP